MQMIIILLILKMGQSESNSVRKSYHTLPQMVENFQSMQSEESVGLKGINKVI